MTYAGPRGQVTLTCDTSRFTTHFGYNCYTIIDHCSRTRTREFTRTKPKPMLEPNECAAVWTRSIRYSAANPVTCSTQHLRSYVFLVSNGSVMCLDRLSLIRRHGCAECNVCANRFTSSTSSSSSFLHLLLICRCHNCYHQCHLPRPPHGRDQPCWSRPQSWHTVAPMQRVTAQQEPRMLIDTLTTLLRPSLLRPSLLDRWPRRRCLPTAATRTAIE